MKQKLSFEDSQSLWIKYMVQRITWNLEYPRLGIIPVLSYDEWCKPDLYYIDGINQKELQIRHNGKEYLSEQIETFKEWFTRI